MEENKIKDLIARDTGNYADWGVQITCPYCYGNYTHFESTEQKETDNGDVWEGRGGAARVAMFCEQCPQLFYIRIGEHKGFSFLGVKTSNNTSKFHEPS